MFTKLFPILSLFSSLLVHTTATAAPHEVEHLLQAELHQGSLECRSGTVKTIFEISVSSGELQVKAYDQERGENYSVSKASMENGQIKITLTNDVDGPLAQDLLIIPLEAIISRNASIQGLDVYSEQYDGTTQRFPLDCQIESSKH